MSDYNELEAAFANVVWFEEQEAFLVQRSNHVLPIDKKFVEENDIQTIVAAMDEKIRQREIVIESTRQREG